jgi:hypothetical protein
MKIPIPTMMVTAMRAITINARVNTRILAFADIFIGHLQG